MKKTTILRIVLLPILILVIFLTFKDSAGDIFRELGRTSPMVLAAVLAASVAYHLVEAWITWSMIRCYQPEYRYHSSVYLAFYCSFFRLATLGSASGVAQVFYLTKKGLGYSECISMFTIQYVMHRTGMALFVGLTFLISWPFMIRNYRSYLPGLVFAFVLTVLICIGLVLLICWRKSHELILLIVGKINKSGKLDRAIEKLEEADVMIHDSGKEILGNKKLIISMLFKNLLKFFFWYSIPFLFLFQDRLITLLHSLSVTSLGVLTAAVIPAPSGIGSSEFVLSSLFRVVTGPSLAGAVTLLYRAATFVFPFAVGGLLMMLRRVVLRRRGTEEERLRMSDLQQGSMRDQ